MVGGRIEVAYTNRYTTRLSRFTEGASPGSGVIKGPLERLLLVLAVLDLEICAVEALGVRCELLGRLRRDLLVERIDARVHLRWGRVGVGWG